MPELNIVTIGGGDGHTQVLLGLKNVPGIRITAITPVTDDGRSVGRLHRDYGTSKCVGDLTKCAAALCPDQGFAEALMYRFESGDLKGYSIKNILMAGFERALGLPAALEAIHDVYRIGAHRVLPASLQSSLLMYETSSGAKGSGEVNLDNIASNPLWDPKVHGIKRVWLKKQVRVLPEAARAIKAADLVVLCPGDLFTSIIPVLLVRGIRQALAGSSAKLAALINIMTKAGETDNFGLKEFVAQLEKYAGRRLDRIVCNSRPVPQKLVRAYRREHKVALVPVNGFMRDPRLTLADLLAVQDGFIRHDPKKCAAVLRRIFR